MKKVAVIILNWNGSKLLRRYLHSVIENTNAEIADVIVADNGSTDESRDVLNCEFAGVETLLFTENYGFAEGYNRAIEQTHYEYTVLLNSDVRTPKGWLEPLLEFMEKHPQVGAVQPKLLQDRDDGKMMFEYAGAAGGFIDRNGFPFCRGRIFDAIEEDKGQYDTGDPISIFWATGACLMVRSELYLRLGGLDPRFFAHMEEIDLCWRIRREGYDICAVTASHVFHLGGGSLPQGNPRKVYLNFRNNLLLLHKNLPQKEGRRKLFVRRLYDTLAFFAELAKFHFGGAKAILRAHRDFRKMRGAYTDFPSRDVRDELPACRCNIIVDYYLRHRRVF